VRAIILRGPFMGPSLILLARRDGRNSMTLMLQKALEALPSDGWCEMHTNNTHPSDGTIIRFHESTTDHTLTSLNHMGHPELVSR